jgi:hypothetical protein
MTKIPFMALGRDGYIYFWNAVKGKYLKVRDIEPERLPYDVKEKIHRKQMEAKRVMDIPCG